jgi:ATP-dependent helicase Lhr and Lhr-like helicase
LTTSAYFSLSKRLQQAIVKDLGWRKLRPVQEAAIPPLLRGDDTVILAPTAGGKTESALLPLLDNAFLQGPSQGPNILYLCPLKALINNLLPRLNMLAGMLGKEAFAWHGEVTASARKRFLKEPKSLLLTTPESLQVILSKRDLDPAAIFQGLQAVVIDEVHAFCGEPRGDQLLALLAGLDRWCNRPLQRVGLSATVGNPEHLLQWLNDRRPTSTSLVDPTSQGSATRRRIEVHPVSQEPEECADRLAGLMKSVPKSLLFVDSRRKAEQMRHLLANRGLDALAHHSSLSQELREKSELVFKTDAKGARKPQVIVCTSTLELGLDVGDIDRVFQWGAPSTVSAFLQRFGRSGRRAQSVSHMGFVTDCEASFLQAVALVRLALKKRVEPVLPSDRSFCVLVQQILIHVLRHGGLAPDKLWAAIGDPGCFAGISEAEKSELSQHLMKEGWLVKSDGKLMLGERTEKEFGRSHFMDLLSVFSGARLATVKSLDGREVGTVDCGVAEELGKEKTAFLLGGGSWKSRDWDPRTEILTVVPSMGGKALRWSGARGGLSFALVREMRQVVVETDPVVFLGPRASEVLDGLRNVYGYLDPERPLVRPEGERTILETWAGERVNACLANAFSGWLGVEASFNATEFRLNCTEIEWLQTRNGRDLGEPFLRAGLEMFHTRSRVSGAMKFAELLPDRLGRETQWSEEYDMSTAVLVLRELMSAVSLSPAMAITGESLSEN